MGYRVPFVDAVAAYGKVKPEVDAAIFGCLEHGDLVYRHQLKAFESEFAGFIGSKHVVGLNSGYHALLFALLGAGVGAGDEVITVAHTFVATVSAIVHTGATPVLIEVADDFNMDPARLEAAITPRTKAVLPVHLNGRVAPMTEIMAIAQRHGLAVIEDAAQAIGARHDGRTAGTIGAAGCFSFYPFKVLGGYGDGGALCTDDDDLATMARRLRYNGEDRETGEYHHHGHTALLDNIQAAVLSVKLRHLPGWLERRRELFTRYDAGLRGTPDVILPPMDGGAHHDICQNYVLRTPSREAMREHLREEGIETLVHWPKPMWEHRSLGLPDPGLAFTERLCREVISLPLSPELTDEQADEVVAAVRSFR